MSMVAFAEAELRAAGYFDKDSDYGGLVGPAVLEMVQKFAEQGHSGGSAPLVAGLFRRLVMYKPLGPLKNPMDTGEYHDVSGPSGTPPLSTLQSTRLSSLFSDDSGKTWHDIDKRIPWWRRKLLRQRRAYVQFPYMPGA